MAIDRDHAFGNGRVYRRPTPKLWNKWLRLSESRVASTWRQFDQSATVPASCRLGINAWCVNMLKAADRISLGEGVICRGLLRIEDFGSGKITIGANTYLGDDTLLSSSHEIQIGDHVLVAHGVHIFDNDSHPLDSAARLGDYLGVLNNGGRAQIASAPVRIGDNAWIGFNVIILKGVTIGANSVVAAGSVVTRDVPPDCVAAGNPAVVVKTIPHVSD